MDINKLDWTLLRSFLAVIDTGSLLGAAKQLGTYQPTLSRQITELESQLGIPLFERTGRGLNPTAAALAMLDPARAMAQAAQNVVSGLRLTTQSTKGTVRIAVSEVAGSYLLSTCIAQLRSTYPEISIDITVSNKVSNLLRREADIALRMARPAQNSLVAKKVADLPMGAFAAKKYIAIKGTPSRLSELGKFELIGLDSGDAIIRGLSAAGLEVNRESFTTRTDDQVLYTKLIESGAGIGFIPQFAAVQLRDVAPVLPKVLYASIPLWLVVHREIKGNPMIKAVFDSLKDSLCKATAT